MQSSNNYKSGIYRIRNTHNGKFYIGSAQDFLTRRDNHWSELRRDKHHCKYLQNAYNAEPDKTVFVFEYPLLVCSDDKPTLCLYEQQFIDFYKNSGRLYNMSMLADRPEMTEEICKKIGDTLRGRPTGRKGIPSPLKGILRGPLAAETRAKLSAIRKGRKLSEEHKAKIGATNRVKLKGRMPSNKGKPSPFKGIPRTPEIIEKMTAARRQRLPKKHVEGQTGSNRCVKLVPQDIFHIRASNESGVALAKKFGVTQATISDIRCHRSWKHIV